MKLIDLSRGIFSAELYPGTAEPHIEMSSDMSRGGEYNCSTLTFDLHTATHVDAESHFFPDGNTIDRMPLQRYMGRCRVWNCYLENIESLPSADDATILLLKNAPFLTECDCRSIIERGYRTIGTDRLSPSAPENEGAIHRLLLGDGIGLIESLDMSGVCEGEYFFAALPLRIEGAEASPVRAVIIDTNQKPDTI